MRILLLSVLIEFLNLLASHFYLGAFYFLSTNFPSSI